MARAPAGSVVFTAPSGATVRYSPTQGSSTRYRVTCPHGAGVNERRADEARWSARHPGDWCPECAAALGSPAR